jgi:hypothetical protein
MVVVDNHLEGVGSAEKNARLLHIIYILRENDRVGQLATNDGKPVSDFVFGLLAISLLISRLQQSCF